MSICAENEILADSDYIRRLSGRLTQERQPAYGSITLTNRCNIHCIHCYAQNSTPGGYLPAREMDTTSHIRIIDEITHEGCVFLLLTGGEPLLRPDFSRIYTHAKKNGLLVSVFTNGTLVTDRMLALFTDLPPRRIELSIYGATSETHDAITGSKGSFERTRHAIDRFVSHGLTVNLKTVLMTRNLAEFEGMKRMALDYGAMFRFDPLIFPRMNGDSAPLSLRLSPEDIVKIDFADSEKIALWQEYAASHRDFPTTDRLYLCAAGVTGFWIDPYGNLQPCIMTRQIKINIANGGFAAAWKDLGSRMAGMVTSANFSCRACDKKALCGYCPGFFELETGSETNPPYFLCTVGKLRLQFLDDGHREA